MGRKWAVNASPLIILGKLSRLSLLTDLAETLVIPTAVAEEIEQGPEDDPARVWLSGPGRDFVKDAGAVQPGIANWDLGTGENHVLSWALKNPGFEVILDDLASRKCATVLSIPVRGTLGVLLLAKKEGRVATLEPLLGEVLRAGLRISTEVLEAARRLAGEAP